MNDDNIFLRYPKDYIGFTLDMEGAARFCQFCYSSFLGPRGRSWCQQCWVTGVPVYTKTPEWLLK